MTAMMMPTMSAMITTAAAVMTIGFLLDFFASPAASAASVDVGSAGALSVVTDSLE